MKIQLETRAVVIGVVAVISVVAILGLAQTPTPTCTPSSDKLKFQIVLKCVQKKDFLNLVPTLAKVPCSHKHILIDNSTDGNLTTCEDQDAWCKTDTHNTSNVTQRVAFISKAELDAFMSAAFSTLTPTPTP